MSDKICPNTKCADHVQELLEQVAMLKAQLKATENLRRGESVVNTKLLEELADLRTQSIDNPDRCPRCGVGLMPGMMHSCH